MQVSGMVAVQILAVLLCSSTVRCLSGPSNGSASGIRKPEVVELPAGPGSGIDTTDAHAHNSASCSYQDKD